MFDFYASSRLSKKESWLTSLTDLMMLLVVFFVIQIAPESVLSKEAARQKKLLDETIKELQIFLEKKKIIEKVFIKRIGNTANISFDNSFIFPVGSSEMGEKQKLILTGIIKKIIKLKETHEVKIEGHTDNTPISTKLYHSNWELSSARALSVLRVFIANDYNQERLSAQGFGEFHPLFPNTDENGKNIPENQAKNRRVRIHIKGTEHGYGG